MVPRYCIKRHCVFLAILFEQFCETSRGFNLPIVGVITEQYDMADATLANIVQCGSEGLRTFIEYPRRPACVFPATQSDLSVPQHRAGAIVVAIGVVEVRVGDDSDGG